MGRVLNIRVQAFTYNEEEVAKSWPALCLLAWPFWSDRSGFIRKAPSAHAKGIAEESLGPRPHGVIELAEALRDGLKFADWPEATRNALDMPVQSALKTLAQLNKALADWDPKTALALSDELEDWLSKAETSLG